MNDLESDENTLHGQLDQRAIEIEKLKNELNSLLADNEELLNEKLRLDQAAAGIRKDNDLLAESAKNLELDNDATRRKMDELEKYSSQLKAEEGLLKEKIMGYENENNSIDGDINNLMEDIANLEGQASNAQSELISLQKDVGITFVYVTHDQGEALALSHRIAVMNEGRVSQIGTPDEVYEFPANRFVADFIGTCNLLDARVMVLDGERVTLNVAGLGTVRAWSSRPCQQGDRGVLALRPEKIQLDRAPSSRAEASHFAGTIRGQMYLGDVTVYKVEIGNAVLVEALLPNSTARGARLFAPGDQIYLSWGYDAGRFIHDG